MERLNDNIVAIDMLKDVTQILNAIEISDTRYIEQAIKNLKEHTSEFEKVFYEFKVSGVYGN